MDLVVAAVLAKAGVSMGASLLHKVKFLKIVMKKDV